MGFFPIPPTFRCPRLWTSHPDGRSTWSTTKGSGRVDGGQPAGCGFPPRCQRRKRVGGLKIKEKNRPYKVTCKNWKRSRPWRGCLCSSVFFCSFWISRYLIWYLNMFFVSCPKFSWSNDKNWFLQVSKETVAFAAEMDSRVCCNIYALYTY